MTQDTCHMVSGLGVPAVMVSLNSCLQLVLNIFILITYMLIIRGALLVNWILVIKIVT